LKVSQNALRFQQPNRIIFSKQEQNDVDE